MKEVEFCLDSGRRWLYLGLFVRECPSMNYKANFKPYELRSPDGTWVEYR
jgi:arginine-tRNA-protein transferase